MRDIDEVLRDDAQRWQTRLPEPPEFAATLAGVVARPPKQRPWKLLLSVAATVVLVVAAVALALRLGHTSSAPPQHGPASIVVNGKRIPYAGVVPWGAPISYPSDRSVVYVYADNDALDAVANVCGVQADRARVVQETSASVTIRVLGYAKPLPDGVFCAGVGHSPVPVAVHLQQPLGSRKLVDASGKSHRVLDAATVPMPHSVPAACTPQPLEWSEATGIAFRNWYGKSVRDCALELEYGPKRAMDRERAPGGVPGSVSIGDVTAQTWRFRNRGGVGVTFKWSPRPGFEVQLYISTDLAHQFTTEQELAIARSVH